MTCNYLSIILSIIVLNASAQTGNDCATARNIAAAPYSDSYSTCGRGTDYQSSQACEWPGNEGEDVIYKFKPASSGTYTLSVTKFAPERPSIVVRTDCNFDSNNGAVACVDEPFENYLTVTANLTANTTYYIKIDGRDINAGCGTYQFNLDPPPSNDLICNAVGLTVNAVCKYGYNSGAGVTGDPNASCITEDNTVWYYFVATDDSMTVTLDNGGSLKSSQLAVFSSGGSCTSIGAQVGCISATGGTACPSCAVLKINNLVPGTRYYVMVDGANTRGNFCISVVETQPDPPVYGSSCKAPRVLFPKATCSITNQTDMANVLVATMVGVTGGTASCNTGPAETYLNAAGFNNGTIDAQCAGDETTKKATWVKFTATSASTDLNNNNTLPLQTGALNYTVFTGSCGSLTQVGCYTLNGMSSQTITTNPGTDYLVMITAANGNNAPNQHWLCITSGPGVSNNPYDECSNAMVVQDGIIYRMNNALATPAGTLCSGTTHNNVWLKWKTPSDWALGKPAYLHLFNQDCNDPAGLQLSVYASSMTCMTVGNITPACELYTDPGVNRNFYGIWTPKAGQTYLISIDGACGTVCDFNVQINDLPVITNITATFNKTDVLCKGTATGSATVVPTGGVAPYSYSWNTTPTQTTATATNLAAGNYTVIIKDANLVTGTAYVTITEPAAVLAATVNTQSASCNQNDGSATAVPSGGVAPYTYLWNTSPAQTTATATNLAAGLYTVTVKDANNCTLDKNIVIGNTNSATVNAGFTNITCNGGSDGSINASTTGGTAPFTYSLDGVNYAISNIFTNLTAGSYTVSVKDATGCISTKDVTLLEPDAYQFTPSVTNTSCGLSNGGLNVLATGGTAPLSYSLDNVTFQASGTFSNLAAGTYTVYIKDANNCPDNIQLSITDQPSAIATLQKEDIKCSGDISGTITVVNPSGTNPLSFSLDNVNFNSNSVFSPLAAGTYTVYIKDGNNCITAISTTLTEPSRLNSIHTLQDENCAQSDGMITISASGGTSPYTYTLNSNAPQSSGSFTNLAAGSHVITVTDANMCSFDTTLSIGHIEGPEAGFASDPSLSFKINIDDAALSFMNQSLNAVSYLWDFGDGTTSTETNPVHTYTAPGIYQVSLTAFGNNNCTDVITYAATIVAEINSMLYVPEAFSPNGDQINDFLEVEYSGLESFSIRIFNRWGEVVYQSNDPAENWDGKVNGNIPASGVYVYVVNAKGADNKTYTFNGTVSLIQ